MKFLKVSFTFFSLIFLSGCLQSSALLAPSYTVVSSGNVLQAGFQYGINTAIKSKTGKNTLEHFKEVVDSQSKDKKFKLKFTDVVQKKFDLTRNKLTSN